MHPMSPSPASEHIATLLATCLQATAEGDLQVPLACIPTADLARASQFFQHALGFESRHRIPNVFAQLRWGSTAAMLLQFGATPARFERAERPCDKAPVAASTLRIATRQLHQLHRHMRASLHRHGTPAGLTSPVWQAWNAWECSCVDLDGNTLVFTQQAGRGSPQP